MTKNTKTILGVVAVAGIGYYLYNQYMKNKGAKITSFKSYCGGLIDKDSEGHNPWKYKITWNPMNVVKAGQGGISRWREDSHGTRICK
jgi:saccharopine dehydrogenase-like NADP-dependent oxidoreductase